MKPSQPHFEPVEKKSYRLVSEWAIAFSCPKIGWVDLSVYAGFSLDGESSPWFVWGLWGSPVDATNAPQATAHDALYKTMLCDRATADLIWLEIAKLNGVGLIERQTKYRMLRLLGINAWNSNLGQADHWKRFVKLHIERPS